MIEFDPELDCSQLDVFQPVVITAYEEEEPGVVLIEQWDGTGDELYCVGIPTKHIDAFIGALQVALRNPEKGLVLDCARKECYFEGEKDES